MTVNTPEGVLPENPPAPPAPPVAPADEVFTKEDLVAAVEAARKQEKDKLYGKIEDLSTKVNEFTTREQQRAEEEKARQAEAARLAKEKEERDLDAKTLLERRQQEWEQEKQQLVQTWESKFAEIQQSQAEKEALLQKEREFAQLQAYTQRRLAEEADNIAPQLADFVNGRNPEEIEQSIAVAKAKSAEIAQMFQSAMQQAPQQRQGVSVTGFGPIGPVDFQAGTEKYSIEDIRNMDMQTYAKLRGKLNVGGSSNNHGMFG